MTSSKAIKKNKTKKTGRMQGVINNLKPYGEKFAEDAGALGNKLVGHIGEFAKENAEKLITAGLTVTTAFATKKLGMILQCCSLQMSI